MRTIRYFLFFIFPFFYGIQCVNAQQHDANDTTPSVRKSAKLKSNSSISGIKPEVALVTTTQLKNSQKMRNVSNELVENRKARVKAILAASEKRKKAIREESGN